MTATSEATSTGQTTAQDRTPMKKKESVLQTAQGTTSIADTVVQKIASMAAREVDGVHRLGGNAARAFGAIRERIPGSGGPSLSAGVAVEVGERQAAIDLNVVVEYGAAIADLSGAIRRNVISSIERMTGLEVTEVNISVDDIYIPGEESEAPEQSRVL